MTLMDWFRRKALQGSPAFLESLAAQQVTPYPAIGGTNINLTQINRAYETMQNAAYSWIYQSQPAVRSVIDFIARNAAQLGPPKLYERVGLDARVERPTHSAVMTLQEPNNGVTPGGSLMLGIISDFLVYDNAYALKLRRQPNDPLVLLQLPPHCVGIVGQMRFAPEGYNIYRADGTYFFVPPEDMIHWHGYNPADSRIGISRLETLREVLSEEAAMQSMNVELAKSGLGAPGHIERPLEAPDWTPTAKERFEEDWANRFANRERKTPVLEEGMVFKEASVSPKDAEVLKSRQFGREEVAAEYGMWHMPPQGEEERQQFYSEVLAPILDQYAWWLNLQLLSVEYDEPNMYFETSLDEKLIGDDRLRALVSASGGPVLTRDEARKRLGLEPKPGGDQLITPLNVLVGGKPSVGVMPPQDPNGPAQDGSHRTASIEELVAKELADRYEKALPAPAPKDDPSPETKELEQGDNKVGNKQLLARRAAQKARRDEYHDEILDTLVRNFDRLDRAAKSESDGKSINWDRWRDRLERELLAVAKRIIQREGGIQAARLGLADIDMSRTEAWLLKMSKERAKDIAAAMQDALDGGDRAKVLGEARNVAGPRAASTLASGFASFAVREAGDQAPGRERRTKTWIVTSENSAHPEMDGETVGLDKKFSNGKQGPPADHPGCECLVEVN